MLADSVREITARAGLVQPRGEVENPRIRRRRADHWRGVVGEQPVVTRARVRHDRLALQATLCASARLDLVLRAPEMAHGYFVPDPEVRGLRDVGGRRNASDGSLG